MEKVRGADGDHQALFPFPSHRCESAADGSIRGETLDRSDSSLFGLVRDES